MRLFARIRRRYWVPKASGLACKARGAHFEREAARWLRRRGYRILGRNLRAAGGEIDLLCRRGRVLIVVEVRVRKAGLLAADLSVGRKKEARLAQTFRALRPRLGNPAATFVRGDLLIGDGAGRWHLLEDALDLSGSGRPGP